MRLKRTLESVGCLPNYDCKFCNISVIVYEIGSYVDLHNGHCRHLGF